MSLSLKRNPFINITKRNASRQRTQYLLPTSQYYTVLSLQPSLRLPAAAYYMFQSKPVRIKTMLMALSVCACVSQERPIIRGHAIQSSFVCIIFTLSLTRADAPPHEWLHLDRQGFVVVVFIMRVRATQYCKMYTLVRPAGVEC